MTVIAFVRHGITDWNKAGRIQGQTDIELNAYGRQQARSLATRLQEERFDRIYTSDLSRAHETARLMNEGSNLPIVVDERLREVSFGLLEGKTIDERIARWGEQWREADVGKESMESIEKRARSLVDELLIKHPNERVLLVTHGAFIANSLRFLVPHFDTTERIENASITIIEQIDGKWTCTLYNATEHLS